MVSRKVKRKQTKVKRAINKKKQTFKINKFIRAKRRSKKNFKIRSIQNYQSMRGGRYPPQDGRLTAKLRSGNETDYEDDSLLLTKKIQKMFSDVKPAPLEVPEPFFNKVKKTEEIINGIESILFSTNDDDDDFKLMRMLVRNYPIDELPDPEYFSDNRLFANAVINKYIDYITEEPISLKALASNMIAAKARERAARRAEKEREREKRRSEEKYIIKDYIDNELVKDMFTFGGKRKRGRTRRKK